MSSRRMFRTAECRCSSTDQPLFRCWMSKPMKAEMSTSLPLPPPPLKSMQERAESNPTLGEGETGLIIRIDYPDQTVLDQRSLSLGGTSVKSAPPAASCSFRTTRSWPTIFGTRITPRRPGSNNATRNSTSSLATCVGTPIQKA